MGISKTKRQGSQTQQKTSSARALVVPPRNADNKPAGTTVPPAADATVLALTAAAAAARSAVNPKFLKANKSPAQRWWEVSEDVKSDSIVGFSTDKKWFELLPAEFRTIEKLPDAILKDKLSNPALRSAKSFEAAVAKVKAVFEVEQQRYNSILSKSAESKGDRKWMQETIKSGTMSDKVAAMALKAAESPFHEFSTLQLLVGIAGKKEQRPVQLALVALKDLFINNLLPDRALRDIFTITAPTVNNSSGGSSNSNDHLLLHPKMTMKIALLLYFESRLKSLYSNVLSAIVGSLQSSVDFFKRDCLGISGELLAAKPEQEALLLETIVNKIGDPSKATASKAVDVLKDLLYKHPAMKAVVVREVRQFIYRPNLKLRPIFTAVVLLAHIPLQHKSAAAKDRSHGKAKSTATATAAADDSEVAVSLVEAYVSMFERAVREGAVGSRLLSALLTGINSALPYLHSVDSLMQFVDPLFRLAHSAQAFSTSSQALMLLSHLVIKSNKDAASRKKAAASLGKETAAFVNRYYRALYSKLLTDHIYSRSKNTLFLNLLYRSVKSDLNVTRALAFVKRMGLCALHAPAALSAALLLMISEIFQARFDLQLIIKNLLHAAEPELQHTAVTAATASGGDRSLPPGVTAATATAAYGNFEPQQCDNRSVMSGATTVAEYDYLMGDFNATKREPEFAYAADAVPVQWELCLEEHHFHPSVKKFAESLISKPAATAVEGKGEGEKQTDVAVAVKGRKAHKIHYDGDPTAEFTLMAFLNRFAFKNPKQSMTDKVKRTHTPNEEAINTSDIASLPADSIAPDKQFFHKYFAEQHQLIASGRSKRQQRSDGRDDTAAADDDDDDVVEGDGFADADKDSDEEEESVGEEEAEMDRFADKLAEDLMKGALGSDGYINDDNFSDDDSNSDEDDDDDDDDDVMHAADADSAMQQEVDDSDDDIDDIDWDTAAADDSDADNSSDGSEEEDDDCEDFDEADDIAAFGENTSTAANSGASSSALDFEDFVREQKAAATTASGNTQKQQMQQSKQKQQQQEQKKRKKAAVVAADDSEDDYDGLVAYGDEDYDATAAAASTKKSNNSSSSSSSSGKTLKKRKTDNNDGFESEQQSMKARVKSERKSSSARAAGDDFADAAAFEDLMEENVQRFASSK